MAVVEKHRDELSALVHKVVDKALSYKEPLTEDKITDVPELDFTNQGNAVLISEWHALALTNGKYRAQNHEDEVTPAGVNVGRFGFIWDTTDIVDNLARWVMDGPSSKQLWLFDSAEAEAFLKRVSKVKYVMVVRVFKIAQPEFSKDSSSSYKGGYIVGEVRIFDVDGKDHGGVRFAAESSKEIEYKSDHTGTALEDNLYGIAGLEISDALKKQVGKLEKAPSSF
jgi:hypothetical protein